MRFAVCLILSFAFSCAGSVLAKDDASKNVLTDAERARIKSQVETLQKNKLDDAVRANQHVKSDALRQGRAIDEKLKEQHDYVDTHAKNSAWMYGADAMRHAAQGKKAELSKQAQDEKDKVAQQAREKASRQTAAAKKSAETVNQSVEGLKSQVSKDGKYGLNPRGTNLNVRNYGKN